VANVRIASPADAQFLAGMLALAVDWRPAAPHRPVADVLDDPALKRYVSGWPRSGDAGVVAEDEVGETLGAAWYRYFSSTSPGYGFVLPTVPEVAIAVVPHARGTGIGGLLLGTLIDLARARGVAGLSLSVERENPARRLYDRFGFAPVGANEGDGGSVTLLLDLDPAGERPSGGPDWT
jgi:GNAT superfamily N-acetyltransferase